MSFLSLRTTVTRADGSTSVHTGPPMPRSVIEAWLAEPQYAGVAAEMVDEAGQVVPLAPPTTRTERYRLAWVSARQRAEAMREALIETDEERGYVRERLAERDDEVARLVAELAEHKGLVR